MAMLDIKIGKKTFPCRVTMGAMRRFKDLTGREATSLTNADLSYLVTFIYCCVASACNADKTTFDLSIEDFADNLDMDTLDWFFESPESKKK